jgi:tetratricopeptide (TPR) repeat protein
LRESPTDRQPLSEAETELALRAAQIFLTYGGDAEPADRLLDRLAETLAQRSADEAFWVAVQKSARPLLIVSLANRGKYDEAAGLVQGLTSAPVGDLLAVVKGLAEVTDSAGRGQQPAIFGANEHVRLTRLSDLRSRATDMLAARIHELNDADRKAANVLLANSSLADGRADTAAAQFENALAERPHDKDLLVQAAASLASSDDPQAIAQARDYWRRLESLESPGSDAWFKARLKVIETSLALGDVAEARKLLTVTRLLHPQLGGGEMKAEFEAVQRRLGAETAHGRRTESR